MSSWSLLSRHGRALVALARSPDLRVREAASELGVTPRAAQSILNDLVAGGYLERTREGRRNRYLVRGDRSIPELPGAGREAADLIDALLVSPRLLPRSERPSAVVVACSDSRYQEPLRSLLAAEGLLTRAEILLWPGGSSALSGPSAQLIVDAMSEALKGRLPPRVVLVAHQDCTARGARLTSRKDPIAMAGAVAARRRRGTERVRKAFGVEPELWFLTERGALRTRVPGKHFEVA